MTRRVCPRRDLGCSVSFATTGDLDWHLRTVHRARRLALLWESLHPVREFPERRKSRRMWRSPAGFPGRRGVASFD